MSDGLLHKEIIHLHGTQFLNIHTDGFEKIVISSSFQKLHDKVRYDGEFSYYQELLPSQAKELGIALICGASIQENKKFISVDGYNLESFSGRNECDFYRNGQRYVLAYSLGNNRGGRTIYHSDKEDMDVTVTRIEIRLDKYKEIKEILVETEECEDEYETFEEAFTDLDFPDEVKELATKLIGRAEELGLF